MASLQPSSVSNIMKALNELEEKIDSLNTKVADMKKSLNQKANSEIDKIMEKTREIATKEAEVIINESREKANAQSQSITQEGDGKITELQSKIDATFDDAVKLVVSTVLKA
jgi:V/A-type H+-transporting ATPase subunit G/H